MTARAFDAIKAQLAAPNYAALPVLWVEEYAAPPTGPDGGMVPWVLAEVLFGPRDTHPGKAGARLKLQVGVLRCFVHVPKGSGAGVGLPLADELTAALDLKDLSTSEPGELVRLENASAITGDDIASDLRGVYDITLVSVPFQYFHR